MNSIKGIIFFLALLLSFNSSFSQSNNQSQSQIQFTHTPVIADKIPYPGEELKLELYLENTRSFDLNLRAVITRDGELFEIPSTDAKLEINDKPKYTFIVNSPKIGMSYQFIILTEDQKIISSQQYHIKRNCLIEPKLADVTEFQNQNIDNLYTLSSLSTSLENDINSYDQVNSLIEKLIKLLETPKDAQMEINK